MLSSPIFGEGGRQEGGRGKRGGARQRGRENGARERVREDGARKGGRENGARKGGREGGGGRKITVLGIQM